MSILSALMAFCLSAMSAAEEIHGVDYPKIQPMQGLDISKLEGEWTLFGLIGVSRAQVVYECPISLSMEYVHPEADGFTVLMFDPATRGKVQPSEIRVRLPDPDEPARFRCKLMNMNWNIMILGTDYVSYMIACSYSEMEKNFFGINFYVRDRNADVSGGYKVIDKNGFNGTNLASTMRSYRCKSQNVPTA